MPIPVSRDKGKVYDFLKAEHPSWPHAKKVAVMLGQARKAGADIPNAIHEAVRRSK